MFDFNQASDVFVFRSIKDAHNATQITEATFRIPDRDFEKNWKAYFKSTSPDRSFRADLPNLKHLLVVLQGSWWIAHFDAEDNFREWHRNRELKDVLSTMEGIGVPAATVICRVRIPQDHFDALKRRASSMGYASGNSLRCVGRTRLQASERKSCKYDCLLELLSPEDHPLY